ATGPAASRTVPVTEDESFTTEAQRTQRKPKSRMRTTLLLVFSVSSVPLWFISDPLTAAARRATSPASGPAGTVAARRAAGPRRRPPATAHGAAAAGSAQQPGDRASPIAA